MARDTSKKPKTSVPSPPPSTDDYRSCLRNLLSRDLIKDIQGDHYDEIVYLANTYQTPRPKTPVITLSRQLYPSVLTWIVVVGVDRVNWDVFEIQASAADTARAKAKAEYTEKNSIASAAMYTRSYGPFMEVELV